MKFEKGQIEKCWLSYMTCFSCSTLFRESLDSGNTQIPRRKMSPTEREIKILALDRILQDRTLYINEVAQLKQELIKLKGEQTTKGEQDSDGHIISDTEDILQETEELVVLSEEKIEEIANDLRSILNNDNSELIDKLLSQADQINKKTD